MKFSSLLLLTFIILCSCKTVQFPGEEINSLGKLNREFKSPSAAYRTVPFWAWNGDIDQSSIDSQLEDFRDHGMGGVIIHPRYGMLTEYLSDEYFRLVQYAVERGEKLGLKVWLYDENNYPSGFGGGHVAASMPEAIEEGAMLKEIRQYRLLPDTAVKYELVLKKVQGRYFDITDRVVDEKGQFGEYCLYERKNFPRSNWFAGYSYVDLLKPGVSEKFIELTMTGYENVVASHFGKTIPGIFTDEPNIAPQGEGHLIRWTPDLFERFRSRWGYDLAVSLPALSEDSDEGNRVRYHYYKLLLELFIERWSEPWKQYTGTKNLLWTGHYWEHTWPDPAQAGDPMALEAWHQVPGIDMLFNNRETHPEQFGNIRPVKEIASVANQMGRRRTLSESYGGSGWDLSFADMKVNGDWEYVLGVNLMNQHLSYQSITGDRKQDYPLTFDSHEPWWDQYTVLADYFARLSLALSSGKQINRILVLEPTTTAWMNNGGPNTTAKLRQLEDDFSILLEKLEFSHVEYDLGSEELLSRYAGVNNGSLVVGERSYDILLLPSTLDNLGAATANLIENFLGQGGYVIFLGQLPSCIDGSRSGLYSTWMGKYGDNMVRLFGNNDSRLTELLYSEDFVISEQSGAPFFHHRRILDDGQVLFIVNSSREEESISRWNMVGMDVTELDPFSGCLKSYPCVQSDKMLSFSVKLPPSGSILLFISDRELRHQHLSSEPLIRNWKELALTGFNIRQGSFNELPLDYCILSCGSISNDTCYYYEAASKIFREFGFDGNPWSSKIQYKNEILEQNNFEKGTGFTVVYPFFVDTLVPGSSFKIALEHPELYSARLNDVEVQQEKGQHWLDEQIGIYDLGKDIKKGENRFMISIDPMNLQAELAPVVLLGDFSVVPKDTGWALREPVLLATGSWKTQGYPFYSGFMDYSATMICSRTSRTVYLDPGPWKGTVGVVLVNGKEAGQLLFQGDRVRIDQFLDKGSNVITVRIYGSLKNVLGPHHLNPEPGFADPWDFRKAPPRQPAGWEYDLLDYGLYQPFRVLVPAD